MRRLFVRLLTVVMALAVHQAAPAQDVRPIKFMVGFAPGGSLDAVARILATEMSKGLQRPVIVENKPGANGNIAADAVARGPADGTVLLFTFNNHPYLKALYPNLSFDPVADFRPVALVATTPYVLVSNPAVPGKDLADVFAQARKAGKPLNYATVGAGSPQHLVGLRMASIAKTPMTMVHYKGGGLASNDVLAGHVDLYLSTVALAAPQLKAGKLKALAVSTETRVPGLESVPTFAESGLGDLISQGWYALLLPGKSPAALADHLNAEINRALKVPAVHEALQALNIDAAGGTPEKLRSLIDKEQRDWSKVVTDNGLKADQ